MGRPKGSLNDKPWKEAIRKAVSAREKDGGKKLDRLAQELVAAGFDRDVTALKEIGDRLDGKVPQALQHSGEGGGPLVVTWLPPQ